MEGLLNVYKTDVTSPPDKLKRAGPYTIGLPSFRGLHLRAGAAIALRT